MQQAFEMNMEHLKIDNEHFYKISNSDRMRPFFMSVVSDADHWMFVSSNGGLSAGRKNSAHALFPYYTDDKLTEAYEITGSKTVVQWVDNRATKNWCPFSDRFTGAFNISRNLYKNELGNSVIFEEVNHSLQLTFRYQWNNSNIFGFVKKSTLENYGTANRELRVLDGLQNLMPFGVDPDLQQSSSNLVDAYKKNELLEPAGLGIYSLSAIIVDKAEPSEALKANTVWSLGMDQATFLLSTLQLPAFLEGKEVVQETDVRAEKGAYLGVREMQLSGGGKNEWRFMADVGQSTAQVIDLGQRIVNDKGLAAVVERDIARGSGQLMALTAAADARQTTANRRKNTRHHANVLFNCMRGGIFDDHYTIGKKDFVRYLSKANRRVCQESRPQWEALPNTFSLRELRTLAWASKNKDFTRLCVEYLPLKFSRRHGDPSRPWNKFSINLRSEKDGSKVLDYEGNWRDIFQNWEALAHSYPEFMEGMLHKFLNASTFDGYNPYRVTKDGFDWETIEPDDPWSYIGYWGDHQIIYLLKFLEFMERHYPGRLAQYGNQALFVYAQVPYRIKGYGAILANPKDTIVFDAQWDRAIRDKRGELGADGALWDIAGKGIYHVSLMEKLLATLLAKCSNFIPEGGIWMNTQRPEWNDANNALVGNGVSMVTLYYMRRFLGFFGGIIRSTKEDVFAVSEELGLFFTEMMNGLDQQGPALGRGWDGTARRALMDVLGTAASWYRQGIYDNGFSGRQMEVQKQMLLVFVKRMLALTDQSITANRREDGLYHAYNLMTVEKDQSVSIGHLSEMLEGQVAVLSSGFLDASQSLDVLDALKESALFREDQYSYLLYPNKTLPRFVDRNTLPKEALDRSALLLRLVEEGNTQIIEKDSLGGIHFNGHFNNVKSLERALKDLDETYQALAKKEAPLLAQLFEEVFNHKAFTGRSGTFYGYEGLGSIYWHMVSKLLLAVQECCLAALEKGESKEVAGRLLEHYFEINAGIGVHKSPGLYGAFPTDPYSHTPGGKGAQQPGMTGQVKEDILSRFGELGVFVRGGQLHFRPYLLLKDEFLKEASHFEYVALNGSVQSMALEKDTLGFTYCQIPIKYRLFEEEGILVHFSNGTQKLLAGHALDPELSASVFGRTGAIDRIEVNIIKP
ncbi:hypothetical protein [Maribacter sp. 2307ULW6-5]|uniref:hypothetical protein n=1 Tax=Maribacter sp. 2307ULW6-5 TaxID=3386275 RepID=UPI0039BD6281